MGGRWRFLSLVLLLAPALRAGQDFDRAVARVERRLHARIGVCALRGTAAVSHRGGERFATCSTFKWMLGAAILKTAEEGRLTLEQPVAFGAKDLLPNSPVTGAHLQEGRMTVEALCAATLTASDNAAANLLYPLVGGPAGLQTFVRALGDPATRCDRLEPDLNTNLPGDPRDTSTPEAMARTLRTALEPGALAQASRDRLLAWLRAATTGAHRIRAGVPPAWAVGDKTGTGMRGAVNDVAVLLPPQGAPIYLCVFTDGAGTGTKAHEAAIAEVARLAVLATRADGSLPGRSASIEERR